MIIHTHTPLISPAAAGACVRKVWLDLYALRPQAASACCLERAARTGHLHSLCKVQSFSRNEPPSTTDSSLNALFAGTEPGKLGRCWRGDIHSHLPREAFHIAPSSLFAFELIVLGWPTHQLADVSETVLERCRPPCLHARCPQRRIGRVNAVGHYFLSAERQGRGGGPLIMDFIETR
jgi:hypothetical protein